MSYRPETKFVHGRMPRVGVLLVNLGTPDAPTPAAVRRYLAEFLSDRASSRFRASRGGRSCTASILRTRPAQVRGALRGDLDQGRLAAARAQRTSRRCSLQGYLGQRLKALGLPADHAVGRARHALWQAVDRRGARSAARRRLRRGSSSCRCIRSTRRAPPRRRSTPCRSTGPRERDACPALRIVDTFHDDPGYIRALAQTVNDYWMKHGAPRPPRAVASTACRGGRSTWRSLPLPLPEDGAPARHASSGSSRSSGRSRSSRASAARQWLEPYTADVLAALGRQKVRRVDVVCPGFVADCLETLEEIGIEGKRTFQAPAAAIPRDPLPERASRVDRARWPTSSSRTCRAGWQRRRTPAERETTLLRAKALGAAS